MPIFQNNIKSAQSLDASDELKDFRSLFHIPVKDNKEVIYFAGNSLGLQPKSVASAVSVMLQDWATLGVAGHFTAPNAWADYHKRFKPLLAPLLGAKEHEVVAMNSLTVNLHLMLAAFYKPTKTKFKILTEAKNFSSDIYALQSQVKLHGFDLEVAIIELAGENDMLDEDDIIATIYKHKDELALILLTGVNYYTGQLLDIGRIAHAAKEANICLGLDLAHAIGNVPLQLHAWQVDFAVWCSYKYLNSGPGGVGGLFVHEQHALNTQLIRPAGWWGNREDDRFQMNKDFYPSPSADGFQLSNAPVISMVAHDCALQIFQDAGLDKVLAKSSLLTSYLLFLLKDNKDSKAPYLGQLLTSQEPTKRGAQLSILIENNCNTLYQVTKDAGFVIDMRSEKVLRIAPAPLYNTFEEVFRLADFLKDKLQISNIV
jgi:kynureninase